MPATQPNDHARSVNIRRTTWFVSLALFAGAAYTAYALLPLGLNERSPVWYVLLTAAWVITTWRFIRVQVSRKEFAVHLTEIPAVLALAYLAPLPAAIGYAVASTVAATLSGPVAPHKVAFNGSIAFTRFVAAATLLSLAPSDQTEYLWVTGAVFAATALTDSMTIVFIGWATRQSTTVDQIGDALAVSGAASAVAGLTLVSLDTHLLIAVLPAVVLLAMWALVRQQQFDRQAHRSLSQAHRLSVELTNSDPRSVLSMGLMNVAEVMNADWATFHLGDTPHTFGDSSEGPHLSVELPDNNRLEVGRSGGFPASATPQFEKIAHLFDNARRKADLTVQIENSALHDRLTGLLSPEGFSRQVEASLTRAGAGTMMMFDLARFAQVNDTLGFAAGDELLREIGLRMSDALSTASAPSHIARLGGDSFGVFVAGEDRSVALDLAGVVQTSLTEPVFVDGVRITVGARVGVAYAPKHGKSASNLVRACGVATRQARHVDPPIVVYRADTDVHTEARLEMVYHLQSAVAKGALEVHYQPKVDAISSRVIGAEALVRWPQEDGSYIAPNDFIPAAEAAGMMGAITEFVLDTALRDLSTWQSDAHHLGVAVNLSPTTLLSAGTPANIAGLLARHGVEPGRLTIEITESVMVSDTKAAAQVLSRLRDIGVRLSIDDFGTGYSSLSYLKDLEIDELKLDRAFVADLAISERSVTIARTVTGLGHSLGLQVVAEGVETPEAAALLREMNMDVVQGFFVARPMANDRFERWLKRHPTYDLETSE